jgi:hypothetical protein
MYVWSWHWHLEQHIGIGAMGIGQCWVANRCCLGLSWLQHCTTGASDQQVVHILLQTLHPDLHGRWILPRLCLAATLLYSTCLESHPCTGKYTIYLTSKCIWTVGCTYLVPTTPARLAWQMDIARALSGYNIFLWHLPWIPHLHWLNIKCHSLDIKVHLASGLYISCSRHSGWTCMADGCCPSCRRLKYFSITPALNPTPAPGKYKTSFIWLQSAFSQQAVHILLQLWPDLHGSLAWSNGLPHGPWLNT